MKKVSDIASETFLNPSVGGRFRHRIQNRLGRHFCCPILTALPEPSTRVRPLLMEFLLVYERVLLADILEFI